MPSARAELHADGLHGVEEGGVLAGCAGGGHPVGGELDAAEAPIGAAARLVSASPTAMRPEAAASMTATGVRSPMAMASPV